MSARDTAESIIALLGSPTITADGPCRDVVFEDPDGRRYLVEVWNYGEVRLKVKPPTPELGISTWGPSLPKVSDTDEPERA